MSESVEDPGCQHPSDVMGHADAIPSYMERTAAALGRSLEAYWPSDAAGRNDMCERTLSTHFAHVLLTDGFAVFAEAQFPGLSKNHVDILGVNRRENWFLACEFKKHVHGSEMCDSLADIERLSGFRLNDTLLEERVGSERASFARSCTRGIGLVAGLKWFTEPSRQPSAEGLSRGECGRRILGYGGRIGDPIVAHRSSASRVTGGYYLQYGFFPTGMRLTR